MIEKRPGSQPPDIIAIFPAFFAAESTFSKCSGIFKHTVSRPTAKLVRGFDNEFYAPHSRHTEVRAEDIKKVKDLEIQNKELEGKTKGLNIEIEALKKSENNLNNMIKDQKTDTDKVRNDYDNIRQELEDKRKEYTNLSNEKNHSDERMRQLQDEVNELERKESEYKNIFKQTIEVELTESILRGGNDCIIKITFN